MESRIRILFLTCALASGLSGCAMFRGERETPAASTDATAAGDSSSDQRPVIEPDVERRKVKVAKIDTEDFEIGAYDGMLSIEDFGVNNVYGARLAYHVTEDFFLEGTLGRSRGGKTSFEDLSGSAQILTDDQRNYTYYALSVGWNALPGEIFLGKNRAYNTALYFMAGVGSTKFGGDNRFTANAGMGCRILLTDWLAAHLDFKDYLYDTDILGRKKVSNNLEASLGLSVFF